MPRKMGVLTAQWFGLVKLGRVLTDVQMSQLHIRLREYLNSDEFLEGIVPKSTLSLSMATVAFSVEKAKDVLDQMREVIPEAAEEFDKRLQQAGDMIN